MTGKLLHGCVGAQVAAKTRLAGGYMEDGSQSSLGVSRGHCKEAAERSPRLAAVRRAAVLSSSRAICGVIGAYGHSPDGNG